MFARLSVPVGISAGLGAFYSSIPACQWIGANLRRNPRFGPIGRCYLMSDFDVNYVFTKRCFRDITCDTDCKFENDHGGVHSFVGGHMGNAGCAPSDPVFYLHHAFIDCIWQEFRDNHQQTDITREYPSWVNGDDLGTPPPPLFDILGFEWFRPMFPFPGLLNGHGIQTFYAQYYKCADRLNLNGCKAHSDCKSSILWCHNSKCTAKIRKGGVCASLPDVACSGCLITQRSRCKNGICICENFPIKAVPATLTPVKAVPVGG